MPTVMLGDPGSNPGGNHGCMYSSRRTNLFCLVLSNYVVYRHRQLGKKPVDVSLPLPISCSKWLSWLQYRLEFLRPWVRIHSNKLIFVDIVVFLVDNGLKSIIMGLPISCRALKNFSRNTRLRTGRQNG
jgi:hypothetical protein